MKTVIIYTDFEYLPKFFVIDGNYAHLDGVVVGSGTKAELESEIVELLFDEDYEFKEKVLNTFPVYEFYCNDVWVINVGWAP